MVIINVYAESGVIDSKADKVTFKNSVSLREELNRFMQCALNREDIRIVVKTCSGYKQAAKEFLGDRSEESYLYTDLDRVPMKRNEWFQKLADDGIVMPEEKQARVSFWVQEMEAWFLKQPQAIEDWAEAEGFRHTSEAKVPIEEHKQIKGKDIEQLSKPSRIIHIILKQRFEPCRKATTSASDKVRKLEYGKLRHAPGIISHLKPLELVAVDKELQDFCAKVERHTS